MSETTVWETVTPEQEIERLAKEVARLRAINEQLQRDMMLAAMAKEPTPEFVRAYREVVQAHTEFVSALNRSRLDATALTLLGERLRVLGRELDVDVKEAT